MTPFDSINDELTLSKEFPAHVICNICGADTVYVRGRYPGQDKRRVCPTCLAETIDDIRSRIEPSRTEANDNGS